MHLHFKGRLLGTWQRHCSKSIALIVKLNFTAILLCTHKHRHHGDHDVVSSVMRRCHLTCAMMVCSAQSTPELLIGWQDPSKQSCAAPSNNELAASSTRKSAQDCCIVSSQPNHPGSPTQQRSTMSQVVVSKYPCTTTTAFPLMQKHHHCRCIPTISKGFDVRAVQC